MIRRHRISGAIVALAVAGLAAVIAQARPLQVDGCRAEIPEGWSIGSGGAAAADSSTARLSQVMGPETVVDMSEGSDFRRVEDTSRLILFSRSLPQGGTHFRSVTRTQPGCAASVIARTRASAAAGREIARSIAVAQ